MTKTSLSIVAGCTLWAMIGFAAAQTTTTTPPDWTPEQGIAIRTYSETQKNPPFVDPNLKLSLGMELPNNVTLYPLPETLKVPSSELYTFGIVNDHVVVVDRATRKVVHVWD